MSGCEGGPVRADRHGRERGAGERAACKFQPPAVAWRQKIPPRRIYLRASKPTGAISAELDSADPPPHAPGCTPFGAVQSGSRFERLIMSRAGVRPARDIINLSKPLSARTRLFGPPRPPPTPSRTTSRHFSVAAPVHPEHSPAPAAIRRRCPPLHPAGWSATHRFGWLIRRSVAPHENWGTRRFIGPIKLVIDYLLRSLDLCLYLPQSTG